jgi:hypothetical protein
MTDEKCHVFLAEGIQITDAPDTEESESIERRLVTATEAVEMARSGKMKTAPCALGLLMCEPLLRERGYL